MLRFTRAARRTLGARRTVRLTLAVAAGGVRATKAVTLKR
jgi:hypothetical protein